MPDIHDEPKFFLHLKKPEIRCEIVFAHSALSSFTFWVVLLWTVLNAAFFFQRFLSADVKTKKWEWTVPLTFFLFCFKRERARFFFSSPSSSNVLSFLSLKKFCHIFAGVVWWLMDFIAKMIHWSLNWGKLCNEDSWGEKVDDVIQSAKIHSKWKCKRFSWSTVCSNQFISSVEHLVEWVGVLFTDAFFLFPLPVFEGSLWSHRFLVIPVKLWSVFLRITSTMLPHGDKRHHESASPKSGVLPPGWEMRYDPVHGRWWEIIQYNFIFFTFWAFLACCTNYSTNEVRKGLSWNRAMFWMDGAYTMG